MSTHEAPGHAGAQAAHGHDFDGEPAHALPADEPRTPGWLPALGGALFVAVAVWFLAVSSGEAASAEAASASASAAASASAPTAPAVPPNAARPTAPANPTPTPAPAPTPRPSTGPNRPPLKAMPASGTRNFPKVGEPGHKFTQEELDRAKKAIEQLHPPPGK